MSNFLAVTLQRLNRNNNTKNQRKKLNFAEQILATEPISAIFVELNFVILSQIHGKIFYKNLFHQKDCLQKCLPLR